MAIMLWPSSISSTVHIPNGYHAVTFFHFLHCSHSKWLSCCDMLFLSFVQCVRIYITCINIQYISKIWVFFRRWLWRMLSSGIWLCVTLVIIGVPQKRIASISGWKESAR
jgi:hypothetical protein